ncbi:hypothetical protein KI387_038099, partial [Taxus chinensis]
EGKVWMIQLLSVARLSLAAKMEEIHVPLLLDLQVGDVKFIFEAQTIQRMEDLVLSTLGWRLRPVTPFSFIEYFLLKATGESPVLGITCVISIPCLWEKLCVVIRCNSGDSFIT